MALETLSAQPRRFHLLGIEWATLVYALLTSLLIVLFQDRMNHPEELLKGRLVIIFFMALIYELYRLRPHAATRFLRNLFPLSLLGYWYPDTYEFCQIFPNLDHVFAHADLALFGCQPSLLFSQVLPSKWWSEIFHMGYFAYYPLILVTVLAPLFTDKRRFEPTAFVVLVGFLMYYVIYLFLPVAGPQYYFQATGTECAAQGCFPALGDYFRYHAELRPSPGPDGFFRSLVEMTQASGERPTAAFPSSHVGMSTVLMLLLWRNNRRIFFCSLPFYVALCCATVYIEAHYLVDVLGGFATAFLFYYLGCTIYRNRVEPGATAF